jgi:hypothetical protein
VEYDYSFAIFFGLFSFFFFSKNTRSNVLYYICSEEAALPMLVSQVERQRGVLLGFRGKAGVGRGKQTGRTRQKLRVTNARI